MQTEAMRRMTAARTTLLLDEPFWGMPALKLQLREDPSCKTAWVDGRTLGFNPTFIMQLPTFAEVVGLFAHEVAHCIFGHPWRREGRDNKQWNEACDRAENPVLRDAKMKLPEGALFELDASHAGKSAEWIFNRLPRPQQPGGKGGEKGKPGKGDGQETAPGNGPPEQGKPQPGEVRDAPTDTAEGQGAPTEEEWKQAAQQSAALAQGQGKLPASMARAMEQVTEARVNWKSVLRRFVQEITKNDYTWSRPNPRYLAQGLYLPALESRELGPLVVFIDTSGSIDTVLLSIFEAEVREVVVEMSPRKTYVGYCDAKVQRVDEFEPGDPVTFKPVGGGGTRFAPAFEWIETLEPPAAMIYLTDLMGSFPSEVPTVPTLWATPKRYEKSVPFGEVVLVDE